MIKHRWRELTKSFGAHVDPEKTEELKRTKSEIENNVTRIFKLIKNEDQGKKDANRKDANNELELVGLIENFYQQYQSLYALYDHLVGESGRIVRGRKERSKGFAFSPSSSDSEYYSSEDVEVSNVKVENEHQMLADSEDLEEADGKHKSVAGSEGKGAINSEYMAALRKLKQEEISDQDLKNEVDERVMQLSALVEAHEAHGNESSTLVKELEGQFTGFKLELESLCSQKRDLEAWKQGKAAEAKQLGEQNKGLHARILELELALKGKADEVSDLHKKLKDNEDMKQEVKSLCAQKGELEKKMARKENELLTQVKGLNDQVSRLQKDLKSLRQQKTGSEVELERKNTDISEHLFQIENLKEEITQKDMVEKKLVEERECLLLQLKDKESEVKSLRGKKKNLEKQIKSRNHETIKLRQENEGLISRIVELESTLTERGNKVCALRKECEDAKNEPSTQLMALTTEVSDLKHELDSLQSKKRELKLQIETERKQYLERLTEMGNQNHNLTEKISDQQRILKEQEDTIKKFSKEHKQAKIWFPESKLNLQFAERKMDELAEKYRIHIQDSVRLLYQRIRVAEQIHNENKESYKTLKERYEKETRDLMEMLAIYQDPASKMKEISATAGSVFHGLDLVVLKFEEGHKNFLQQISRMSNELQSAKARVSGTADEIRQLKHNVERLVTQLKDKEEEECELREKVVKLEESASKEAEEKSNLVVSLSKLEEEMGNLERKVKDKDEDLLSLGEEKREAIRQLCVLIDHHRGRYDDLKEAVLKRSARC